MNLPLDASGRNRPGSLDGNPLVWDDNGNLVSKGSKSFVYDDRNRLVEVRESGVLVASYEYDALDRRVRQTVDGVTRRTVWDGWRAIEEYEESGTGETLVSRRTYGVGLDEVVLLEQRVGTELKAYTPVYDAIGNLAALVDDTGRIVERYAYSTYGQRFIRFDDTPPKVNQLRLEEGTIVVELSEPVKGDLATLVLENLDLAENVSVTIERPVTSGRRAQHRVVITPVEAPEAGHELQLRLPAALLRDRFDNEASSDYLSPPFAWGVTGTTVIEDVISPEIDAICVVDGKVRVATSEPLDGATLGTWTVEGTNTWVSIDDGYGLESTKTLGSGTFSVSLGAGADDLAGNLLAVPPGEELQSFQLTEQERSRTLYEGPIEGRRTTSTTGSVLGFHGLPRDEETGFVYMRNRYYDPELGRFIQPDPLGYVDGPSMYQFALNNPVSFSDPMGLEAGHAILRYKRTAEEGGFSPYICDDCDSPAGRAIVGGIHGALLSPVDMVQGGYQVLRHPIQTAQGVWYVGNNLSEVMAGGIIGFQDADAYDKGKAVGGFFGDFAVGAGVGKAAKVSRISRNLDGIADRPTTGSPTGPRMSARRSKSSTQAGGTTSDLVYAREIAEEASQSAGLKLGDLVDNISVSHGPSEFSMNRAGQLILNLNRGDLLKGRDWALRAAYHEIAHAQNFHRLRLSKFRGKRGATWKYTTSSKRRFGTSYYAREELVADRYARWMLRQHHSGASPRLQWSIQAYLNFWRTKR